MRTVPCPSDVTHLAFGDTSLAPLVLSVWEMGDHNHMTKNLCASVTNEATSSKARISQPV